MPPDVFQGSQADKNEALGQYTPHNNPLFDKNTGDIADYFFN
jgi:hypothetical protein